MEESSFCKQVTQLKRISPYMAVIKPALMIPEVEQKEVLKPGKHVLLTTWTSEESWKDQQQNFDLIIIP